MARITLKNIAHAYRPDPQAPEDWAVRGLLFCTAVGLTFGLWPALKASRLDPIEALGYE